MKKKILLNILAFVLILTATYTALTFSHLALPAPTGPYAIGRTRVALVDSGRQELFASDQSREVILEIWYPAKAKGTIAPYVPQLQRISGAFVENGELNRAIVWGLGFVKAHASLEAAVAPGSFPLVLFSPGNATNVEFYAAYGEELASNGYIVIGLNHPYDVTAVELRNGDVALFKPEGTSNPARTAERIAERVRDVRFVLDQLALLNQSGRLAKHLDLERIGIAGHSLGGLTAAGACAEDVRLRTCINIDGLQGGGTYSVLPNGKPPEQPFLFITKENALPKEITDDLSGPNHSLVVVPNATHQEFADGPLFEPHLNPLSNPGLATILTARRELREFLAHTLQEN